MKDIIIVATDLEIKPFLSRNGYKHGVEQSLLFKYADDVEFLFTGVGVPNTILQLASYCAKNIVGRVLQLGFAGSFNTGVKPGELVEVSEDCFGDLGLDDNGRYIPLHEIDSGMAMYTAPSAGWIINPRKGRFDLVEPDMIDSITHELRKVSGITVSTGSGSQERINMLKASWNADVETMEGAAAMLFCMHNELDFRQVRCISNWVEPRDYSKWNTELAADRLSAWLTLYIERMYGN